MNSDKTLIIDDAVPYAHEMFSHLGQVITLPGKEINHHSVRHAHALIVRSRTQVNKTLLKHSSISFVGSTVVGLDHIDQTYLHNNRIQFYSAQGCNANSVAEFVITALFDLAEHYGFDLTQKTLGIIGVGNVGKRVHQKARILGIKCLLNDPPRALKEHVHTFHNNQKEQFVSLNTCLKADILTVHTPLTLTGPHKTLNLLSDERLQQISPHQIIINTARGGIINEKAWQRTPTYANVIDCWENEPKISPPLYQTAYLATPHIAGHSLDAKVAGSRMVYQALCDAWKITPQSTWQKILPPPPKPITITKHSTMQAALNTLFKQTHDIHKDDQAIRSDDMKAVHQKYEHYRRHFPIYREWHQHRVYTPKHPKLKQCLTQLGFQLI